MLGECIFYAVFHSCKAALRDAFRQNMDLEGATIYTTLFPANTDAQWIADSGIKELVYLEKPLQAKDICCCS